MHFVLLKGDFPLHLDSLFVEALSLQRADVPSQQSTTSWYPGQNVTYGNWQSSTGLREAVMDYAGWKGSPPTQLMAAKMESCWLCYFLRFWQFLLN